MKFLRYTILEAVLLLVCIYLSLRTEHFLEANNILRILVETSMQGLIALGMTMVIIAGEIDLSVGSAVASTGCIMALIVAKLSGDDGRGWSETAAFWVAIPAVLVVGACTGMFTGFMRVRFRVPSFISTLAWMGILRGFAGLITDGKKIVMPEWFSAVGADFLHVTVGFPFLGFSSAPETAWKIPVPAVIFLGTLVLLQFIMGYTSFGRSIYAVGGNAEAARLSGINVTGIRIAVMTLVSLLAVVAGILQASRLRAGDPKIGDGWELNVIAAVIIGGTSLAGGSGRIWGTFIGIIFLGVLVNGMTHLGMSFYWQNIVRGILIFVAVLLNMSAPSGSRK